MYITHKYYYTESSIEYERYLKIKHLLMFTTLEHKQNLLTKEVF